MPGMNLGLSLGLGGQRGRGAASKGPLCDAIQKRVCVSANEKKKQHVLAPHVVYVRDGEQRLAAVTVETDGNAPNKAKLELFKVVDLTDIAVLDRPFTPDPGFEPNGSEYGNEIICIVEMV